MSTCKNVATSVHVILQASQDIWLQTVPLLKLLNYKGRRSICVRWLFCPYISKNWVIVWNALPCLFWKKLQHDFFSATIFLSTKLEFWRYISVLQTRVLKLQHMNIKLHTICRNKINFSNAYNLLSKLFSTILYRYWIFILF